MLEANIFAQYIEIQKFSTKKLHKIKFTIIIISK